MSVLVSIYITGLIISQFDSNYTTEDLIRTGEYKKFKSVLAPKFIYIQ